MAHEMANAIKFFFFNTSLIVKPLTSDVKIHIESKSLLCTGKPFRRKLLRQSSTPLIFNILAASHNSKMAICCLQDISTCSAISQ